MKKPLKFLASAGIAIGLIAVVAGIALGITSGFNWLYAKDPIVPVIVAGLILVGFLVFLVKVVYDAFSS